MTLPAPRPSTIFLAGTLAGCCILGTALGHAAWRQSIDRPSLMRLAQLAERLTLTDLALFTEARYTRHPSQADSHAPFQEHPAALEHFPSGALVAPPKLAP